MASPSVPASIVLSVKGLVLNPSTFDPKADDGSLTIANNVVIDRPSVVATRRGISNVFAYKQDNGDVASTPIELTNSSALSMYQYNNHLLLNSSDSEMVVIKYTAVTNEPYLFTYNSPAGGYTVPDPSDPESRVRGLETNKNFYFITESGTYRLDHIDGQPRPSGSPPGLNGSGAVVGSSGFLPDNTKIAYRVVFGYKDHNQQLVLGAPSSRIIVSNIATGSLKNVDLTFQVPKEIQAAPTEYFFQVYRGHASPDLATEPDDEMALTYEDICSSGTTITISDITPDTLLGASLYTNQGQDGILQSNYRPPWAIDVCTYKQYAFYANTRTLMNADITLISAGASVITISSVAGAVLNTTDTTNVQVGSKITQGATTGIVTSFVVNTSITVGSVIGTFVAGASYTSSVEALIPGDTITFTPSEFGGTPFTLLAAATNNTALGWFAVGSTGNPAEDIQITASNICLVANAYVSNTFLTAYYTSASNDLPGKMNFARLTLVTDTFVITSSHTPSFEQAMPITSMNDSRPNRIYYSKFNQPEAVPVVNYIEVGSANQPIRRIVPLRDGVMILKNDGVFRLSGSAPSSFTVTPIDYNVRILAANTAAELDNKVYFLSDQGIVALSDSDAQIMSIVIDKTIVENTSPDLFPNLRAVAWGLAYQSARKYILFMPSIGTDVQATQQYVYNHIFQLWTRWTLSATCGIIFKQDGKIYLGSTQGTANVAGDSIVYQERKSFTSSDFADNQYTTTTSTTGSTQTVIITNLVLPPNIIFEPGWTLTQFSSGSLSTISTVTIGATETTLTLDTLQTWAAGEVVIYTPVYSEIQTIQLDCNNPAMNKQFTEIVYMFSEQKFNSINVLLSSNTAGIPISDILVPTQRGGWGIDLWGVAPWGGSPSGQGKIRRYMPTAIQRAGWIYLNMVHAEAFNEFGFSGIELYYKQTSTRQF